MAVGVLAGYLMIYYMYLYDNIMYDIYNVLLISNVLFMMCHVHKCCLYHRLRKDANQTKLLDGNIDYVLDDSLRIPDMSWGRNLLRFH